jgi:hypothetical protein
LADFVQKSAVTDDVIQRIHLGDGVLSRDPDGIAVWRTSPFSFYRTAASRHERSFHNHALRELLEAALRDFYEAPRRSSPDSVRLRFAGSNLGLATTETGIR